MVTRAQIDECFLLYKETTKDKLTTPKDYFLAGVTLATGADLPARCSAIVPSRWYEAEHQCRNNAQENGYCPLHKVAHDK